MKKLKRVLILCLVFLASLSCGSSAEEKSMILSPGTWKVGQDIPAGYWTIQPVEGEIIIVRYPAANRDQVEVIVTGFGYQFKGSDILPALDVRLIQDSTISIIGGEAECRTSTADMVWVAGSGARYHKIADCSGMKEPRQIPEDEAIAEGRSPCKNCWK